VLAYGLFINAAIAFLIVAFVLFLIIKSMNKLQAEFEKEQEAPAPEPAPEPEPSSEEKLLTEIRDLLKQRAA